MEKNLLVIACQFRKCIEIDENLLMMECKKAKFLVQNALPTDFALYLNLCKVNTIVKSIPMSTASVERSFSTMNRVLSWARNALNPDLASDLMVISMNKDIAQKNDLDLVLNHQAEMRERKIKIA